MLKHLVNHTRPIEQKSIVKRFNLTCDYEEIMPHIAYHCSGEKPNLEAVIEGCINGLFRSIFCFKEKKEAINPSEIIYIDAQEINSQKAFSTFQVLSEKFGFNAPLEQDRAVFTQHINKNASLINAFPVVLYAHPQGVSKKRDFTTLGEHYMVEGGVNIVINAQFDFDGNSAMDLTQELMLQKVYDMGLVVSVSPQEVEILRAQPKLKKAVQKFLSDYFKEFKKREDRITLNLKTPEDVLEHFKTHQKHYHAMRKIFNEELFHIKQVRPDIVKSWEYYQAFERILNHKKR